MPERAGRVKPPAARPGGAAVALGHVCCRTEDHDQSAARTKPTEDREDAAPSKRTTTCAERLRSGVASRSRAPAHSASLHPRPSPPRRAASFVEAIAARVTARAIVRHGARHTSPRAASARSPTVTAEAPRSHARPRHEDFALCASPRRSRQAERFLECSRRDGDAPSGSTSTGSLAQGPGFMIDADSRY